LKRGILPPPTFVKENGLRLFGDKGLEEVKKIVELERQRSELTKKGIRSPGAS
jgi:hypothetical protein